eukprot:11723359-Alexandrium_andersonii.AAC.1
MARYLQSPSPPRSMTRQRSPEYFTSVGSAQELLALVPVGASTGGAPSPHRCARPFVSAVRRVRHSAR